MRLIFFKIIIIHCDFLTISVSVLIFLSSGITCHISYCFCLFLQVCLPIISAENWKPATKTDQVIQALVALVNDPEPEHPLRADLAEEYSKDKKKFMKNAEEFTKKNSEKRPSD